MISRINFILITLISIAILSSCAENQYDSNNLKHGNWTEYILGDGSRETTQDSAEFVRKIKYDHGTPVGMGKDYFPNGSLQCEFYLISSPYTKDSRPRDKYQGLVLWFNQDTTQIKNWDYYDEYGNWDSKKYFTLGLEEIEKDDRFNLEYLQMNTLNWDQIVLLFQKYHHNPDQFDIDLDAIKTSLYADRKIKKLLTSDSPELNKVFLQYAVMQRFLASVEELATEGNQQDYSDENNDDYRPSFQNQNSSQNNYRSDLKDQHEDKPKLSCSTCYGSGKCSACGKVQEDGYYNRTGNYIRISEIRTGMTICKQCHGRGTFGSDYDRPCSWCKGQGWLFCNTCNYNGHGAHVGQCQTCKGSGFRN